MSEENNERDHCRRNTEPQAALHCIGGHRRCGYRWFCSFGFSQPRHRTGRSGTAKRYVSAITAGRKPPDTTGEQTVTIQPDQVEKIGLKIETVGETLSSEAMSVAATGVVQPNAYKETPVISLLGGVLRSVNGELGQNVGKGPIACRHF